MDIRVTFAGGKRVDADLGAHVVRTLRRRGGVSEPGMEIASSCVAPVVAARSE